MPEISWLKYFSLVILVLQSTVIVLMLRYVSTRSGPKFLNTVVVLFAEIAKLIFSFIIFLATNRSLKFAAQTLKYHFYSNFLDTLKVGIPALIYTIQNLLLFIAIQNLDAVTYLVTYQLKILTTAGFTVLLLHRRLSIFQWMSLIVLIIGVAVVQISNKNDKISYANFSNSTENISTSTMATSETSFHHDNPHYGFIAIFAACVLSGFAGIYFEKILKSSEVSLWIRNIQLSILSIPCAIIIIAIMDYKSVIQNGILHGFDALVWVVVFLQAGGGLIIAVVIKYADNILKVFANSISIIVGIVAQIVIFQIWPKLFFVSGIIMVIYAVFIYSFFPYQTNSEKPVMIEDAESIKNSENVDGNNKTTIPEKSAPTNISFMTFVINCAVDDN